MTDPQPFAPFVAARLWSAAPPPTAPWRRRLLGTLRMAYAVARDIATGRLSLHAASLVYTTILSLVPLFALSFSVLKGFGVHYRFEPLLQSALAPLGSQGQVITERLMEFVDNMDVGVLGTVGLALLFYTAISVVQKVETAFAEIWRVRETRPIGRKFTDYLSVLLIGPVLMFSAIGLATSLVTSQTAQDLQSVMPLAVVLEVVGQLVPFMLVVVAFTFLYKFLPYTHVETGSALVGGLVGGMIWVIAGWVFAVFVAGAGSYTAIYSAFAALIVFFLWMNVNWLILLIGASIAFYAQHPESMPLSPGRVFLSGRCRERLALGVLGAVGDAHYSGEGPIGATTLRRRLHAPEEPLQRVLDALVDAGLLVATADTPPRWVPARPFDETDIEPAIEAARRMGETIGFDIAHIAATPSVDAIEERVEDAIKGAVDGVRVKELLAARLAGKAASTASASQGPSPSSSAQTSSHRAASPHDPEPAIAGTAAR